MSKDKKVELAQELPEEKPAKAVEPQMSEEQKAVLEARDEKATPAPQQIALDAFCRFKFGGKNFDQSAGFASYAKRKRFARCSREMWESLLSDFQNRAIG